MSRYIPHALLILLVLLLPPIMSILIAAVGFGCYTAVVAASFRLHFPGLMITIPEAATLAAKDIARLFSF